MKVSHIVNSVFTSRTYILADDSCPDVWLVDCGDVEPILDQLSPQSVLRGVLLTHAHFDHIYGLPRLRELFPDIVVYTNAYGREMLGNERMNMSRYHGSPIQFTGDNVAECEDGGTIELFPGIQAHVYFTPGHNPSCLTFEADGYLFTGDAYIPGVKVVTTLPGAQKELVAPSLEKIMELAKGRIVCAGHE